MCRCFVRATWPPSDSLTVTEPSHFRTFRINKTSGSLTRTYELANFLIFTPCFSQGFDLGSCGRSLQKDIAQSEGFCAMALRSSATLRCRLSDFALSPLELAFHHQCRNIATVLACAASHVMPRPFCLFLQASSLTVYLKLVSIKCDWAHSPLAMTVHPRSPASPCLLLCGFRTILLGHSPCSSIC